MIYLASAYSDPDPRVRTARHLAAVKATAALTLAGHRIFSPILHGHFLSIHADLPTDAEFWSAYNFDMLARCNSIAVLRTTGWEASVGVSAEIEYALGLNMPVYYIHPLTYDMTRKEFV